MKILIVDATSEGQSDLAGRISSLDPADLDYMDISTNLSGVDDYLRQISGFDILLIGANLAEKAGSIITQAKLQNPDIEIILILPDAVYKKGAFQESLITKLRKILPQGFSSSDLLQELVAIYSKLKLQGKVCCGKVIVVTQSKGGVGATNVCAALGELCAAQGRRTLLWDFDIESKDLGRSFGVFEPASQILDHWIDGTMVLSRKTFGDAIVNIKENLAVLPPPQSMASALDFVGDPECLALIKQILNYTHLFYDVVIVDTSGRLGPATGALIKSADSNIIVMDDSVLGLSSLNSFLKFISPLTANFESTYFLCSGTKMPLAEITTYFKNFNIPERSWSLPQLKFDPAAETWPATGQTLYSVGLPANRKAFEKIAVELELTGANRPQLIKAASRATADKSHTLQGIFQRVACLNLLD